MPGLLDGGNAFFNMGMGLLGSYRDPYNPYGGIQHGLLATQQARRADMLDQYTQMQMQQMQQQEYQRRVAAAQEAADRQRREEAIRQLPPELQAFAQVAPEQAITGYMKTLQPKEPEQPDTWVTVDGQPRLVTKREAAELTAAGQAVKYEKPADRSGEARAASKESFERADKLRDEFTAQSKDFISTRDSYGKIMSAEATPAGDMSLIFNYMKMLDPGSTVREGEYANAENAAGIPARVRAQYNKAVRGDKLAPEQRVDFSQQAGRIYASQLDHQRLLEQRYRDLSDQFEVNPAGVVFDFDSAIRPRIEEASRAKTPPSSGGVSPDDQRRRELAQKYGKT